MFSPMINDITTTHPGGPALASSVEYPEKFYAIQQNAYPDLAPLACPKNTEECFSDCLKVAQAQRGWKINSKPDELRILGVATTKFMRFKDDFVIEVRPQKDGSSTVHMRSRSRMGKSDLGANAKRIRTYFQALKKSW